MSKGIRQSITLLSVIGGCLYQMNDARMISRLDMRELVHTTYGQVINTLEEWPTNTEDDKVVKWVHSIIGEWEFHINTVKEYNRFVVLAKVCERCIADIISKVRDKNKIELLKGLQGPLSAIHSFADPDGINFRAYEKSDELMDKLYELIGWE